MIDIQASKLKSHYSIDYSGKIHSFFMNSPTQVINDRQFHLPEHIQYIEKRVFQWAWRAQTTTNMAAICNKLFTNAFWDLHEGSF